MIQKTTYEKLEQQIRCLQRQVASLKQNEVSLKESAKRYKIAQSNDAMLRISMALPEYPDLEELLDYITGEIKRLLDTQGALVILLDEERQEFFFQAQPIMTRRPKKG